MFARITYAWRTFLSRPLLLSAIIFTVWLPASLLTVFVESTPLFSFDGVDFATSQVSAFALLFAPLSIGALLFAVSRMRAGESPSYTGAFEIGLARWGKLLVARFCANVLIGLGTIAFIVPGIILLLRFSLIEVAEWNDVPGGSMAPNILRGDRIFIHKSAYGLRIPFTPWPLLRQDGPQVGDIVVFHSPEDGRKLVKRVVGLPGDVIAFRDDYHLNRNGTAADYSKPERDGHFEVVGTLTILNERIEGREYPIQIVPGATLVPSEIPFGCVGQGGPGEWTPSDKWTCTLGEGKYFVLGDNRNNSRDSRYFGPVDRWAILGRATAVALSFDREKLYQPRWERFFTRLH